MRFGELEWSEWKQAFSARLLQGPMCLIYQMPKAGSQTVEATLRPLLPAHEMARLHFLSRRGAELFSGLADLPSMPPWMRENFRNQCRLGRSMHHTVKARRLLTPWRARIPKLEVVAGVREPVGLMLSLFFQIHPFYFPDGKGMDAEHCRALLISDSRIDSERRKATALLDEFINDWYDRELKQTFGIDVFETPFPHETGYAIYENAFARVLVYRFENMGSLDTILSDFFGSKRPELINKNIGGSKEYAAAYQDVRRRLSLPVDFLRKQYDTRFVKHFYSAEERERLIQQWHPSGMPGNVATSQGSLLAKS